MVINENGHYGMVIYIMVNKTYYIMVIKLTMGTFNHYYYINDLLLITISLPEVIYGHLPSGNLLHNYGKITIL
jgi:hypothetical protein